ncbi:MAG: sugar kinase [Armatimonadota bacterium]|nr:sugar kinase [bacterium]MDW8319779.1 sugar kinase [Armatimonadota bacterium]
MPQVLSLGELLVEMMRPAVDQPLDEPGQFVGPFPSGAPAIFVDAVARLGMSCGFIGVVGDDPFGRCVTRRLEADGVDMCHVRVVSHRTTGIAFVSYRSDGSRQFLFHLPESAAALLSPEDVHEDYLRGVRALHVTGSALSVSESSREACYRAIDLCKQYGAMVSFDPNIRPELLGVNVVRTLCEPVLQSCDILLPSGAEAAMLTGDADEDTACRALVARGVPIVVLKRGARGCVVFTEQGRVEIPAYRVTEIDPTGAGDAFAGGFVVALLRGMSVTEAARFASAIGALAVTRQGPMEGLPTLAEVQTFMNSVQE